MSFESTDRCIQFYLKPVKTSSYKSFLSKAHTMDQSSLQNYVTKTKFSKPQKEILEYAAHKNLEIEIHGIYIEHLSEVIRQMGLKELDRFLRNPRRKKKFNYHRPLFLLLEDQNGIQLIWIVAFPSPEYVQQVTELTAAFLESIKAECKLSDGKIAAVHYPECDESLADWSGLNSAVSNVTEHNDIVVMGYVEEIGTNISQEGFKLTKNVKIDEGKFGEISVYESPESHFRLVLVGIAHTYWGSAAGRISRAFADRGVSDIIYVSKAGTLLAQDEVHNLASPDTYYLLYPTDEDSRRQWNWVPLRVNCIPKLQRPELFVNIQTGAHLTVPTVVGETLEQSRDYLRLRPATIDNEVGHIAREIEIRNMKTSNRETSFLALHFLTDYLHTTQGEKRQSGVSDLSKVAGEEGATVREMLDSALQYFSEIILKYCLEKIESEEVKKIPRYPFTLPKNKLSNIRFPQEKALTDFVGSNPIIQIVGGAGVGKTFLANKVTRALVDTNNYESAIWVSLKSYGVSGKKLTLQNILNRIFEAIRHRYAISYRPTNKEISELILNTLSRDKIILVFDDSEVLSEETASSFRSVLSDWLADIANNLNYSRIIFVSRNCLPNLHAETFEVGNLTRSETKLFLAQLGMQVDHDALNTMIEISGGNPKALELISPYVEQQADLAVRGFSDKEFEADQASTLSGIVSKISSVSAPNETKLLRRISVFRSSGHTINANAIIGQMPEVDPSQVYDQLILPLVEKNLLMPGELFATYELHPLVQEHYFNQLQSDEEEAKMAHRLASVFYTRIQLKPSVSWQGLEDVNSRIEAIKHAFLAGEWKIAIELALGNDFRVSLVRWGVHSEIVDIYEPLVALDKELSFPEFSENEFFKAGSANMLAIAYRNLGRKAEAITTIKHGLKFANGKWRAILLGNLCLALIDREDFGEAARVAKQAINASQKIGDVRAESYAYGNLGIVKYKLGDLIGAKKYLHRDIALCDENNMEGAAYARAILGQIAYTENNFHESIGQLKQALLIFRSFNNEFREREFLSDLANAYYNIGNFKYAIIIIKRSQLLKLPIDLNHVLEFLESCYEKLTEIEIHSLKNIKTAELERLVDLLLQEP